MIAARRSGAAALAAVLTAALVVGCSNDGDQDDEARQPTMTTASTSEPSTTTTEPADDGPEEVSQAFVRGVLLGEDVAEVAAPEAVAAAEALGIRGAAADGEVRTEIVPQGDERCGAAGDVTVVCTVTAVDAAGEQWGPYDVSVQPAEVALGDDGTVTAQGQLLVKHIEAAAS